MCESNSKIENQILKLSHEPHSPDPERAGHSQSRFPPDPLPGSPPWTDRPRRRSWSSLERCRSFFWMRVWNDPMRTKTTLDWSLKALGWNWTVLEHLESFCYHWDSRLFSGPRSWLAPRHWEKLQELRREMSLKRLCRWPGKEIWRMFNNFNRGLIIWNGQIMIGLESWENHHHFLYLLKARSRARTKEMEFALSRVPKNKFMRIIHKTTKFGQFPP